MGADGAPLATAMLSVEVSLAVRRTRSILGAATHPHGATVDAAQHDWTSRAAVVDPTVCEWPSAKAQALARDFTRGAEARCRSTVRFGPRERQVLDRDVTLTARS